MQTQLFSQYLLIYFSQTNEIKPFCCTNATTLQNSSCCLTTVIICFVVKILTSPGASLNFDSEQNNDSC